VGRPFYIARSNYVVMNFHTELVQMIIAREIADLSISDYFCTFDDSYSLLKSDDVDYLTVFLVWVSAKGLHNPISCWLFLSKEWLFVLAYADSRSTLC